ncbi:MAG: hypothetical protein ACUVUH_02490 [bacterium]
MKILGTNDVEWYSGRNNKTSPKRVRVDDVWREVFSFEKQIFEDFLTRRRYTIFLCHIGDNEIVRVEIPNGLPRP